LDLSEVENESRSERVVLVDRIPEVRTDEIALHSPRCPPTELIVHPTAPIKRNRGVNAQVGCLGKAKALPPGKYVHEWLEVAVITDSNVRPAANKK
jgi:hypothetical protein